MKVIFIEIGKVSQTLPDVDMECIPRRGDRVMLYSQSRESDSEYEVRSVVFMPEENAVNVYVSKVKGREY